MLKKITYSTIYIILILSLVGCMNEKEDISRDEKLRGVTTERLNSAKELFNNKNYEGAIAILEGIEKTSDNKEEIESLIDAYKLVNDNYIESKKESEVTKQPEDIKENNIVNEESPLNNSEYSNITYKNYKNTRYGFSIDYPEFLIEQEPPTNNDGRVFKNDKGTVSLVASGSNNILNYTAESEFNKKVSEFSNITYKNLSDRSYVISWNVDGKIYYNCSVFGEGSMNTFTIEYLESDSEIFNNITSRLYDSFTTGDLSMSH